MSRVLEGWAFSYERGAPVAGPLARVETKEEFELLLARGADPGSPLLNHLLNYLLNHILHLDPGTPTGLPRL